MTNPFSVETDANPLEFDLCQLDLSVYPNNLLVPYDPGTARAFDIFHFPDLSPFEREVSLSDPDLFLVNFDFVSPPAQDAGPSFSLGASTTPVTTFSSDTPRNWNFSETADEHHLTGSPTQDGDSTDLAKGSDPTKVLLAPSPHRRCPTYRKLFTPIELRY